MNITTTHFSYKLSYIIVLQATAIAVCRESNTVLYHRIYLSAVAPPVGGVDRQPAREDPGAREGMGEKGSKEYTITNLLCTQELFCYTL